MPVRFEIGASLCSAPVINQEQQVDRQTNIHIYNIEIYSNRYEIGLTVARDRFAVPKSKGVQVRWL